MVKTTNDGALADRVDEQCGSIGLERGFWVPQLGSAWFLFDEQRWDWSPTVEQMHGYRPGTTTPDTGLLVNHVHPQDREHVISLLDWVRRTRLPFSTRHRIIDTHDQVHDVVVIGAPIHHSRTRAPIGLQCSCVDLTAATSPADSVRGQLRTTAAYGYTDHDRRRRIRAATHC
ncbi:PAS domain-containing protein [Mycolicibacterium iranicum]|jgi:hypothetical protein|uniref:PAS domain-containing protein n=1 Tax=Mycolicibacterium iranicum TaxID=912594 RepID=A0A1X1X1X8_MYCIR|nr:PAS domain-containing protein [Mycolicibacterium iranicum]MCZ0732434.1 PAS domain-containing protein [Mycolicibacterium iranicum]OKH71370.1 hypothetical protein EB72_23555 [Mycobacterium sp. SWH-M1]ORV92738.1 hypothetical protein AWC12_02270 [Mycolicibacterium iranicum]PZT87682.1 MAG: hypothetical protein DI630_34000 [Gordonia sp. (in: high G+C Gram-positive bacteria)]